MFSPPRPIVVEVIDNDGWIIGISDISKYILRVCDIQGNVVQEVGALVHNVGREHVGLQRR